MGDALGSQFFVPANYPLLQRRELPPGPWQWTDDTEMACSVVAVLAAHDRIDQDALARSFAEHHDFDRGYGPAVNRLLRLVREGADWRELAAALFNGQGSWGNGAAMRIAPLGAWYADDPEQATHQAEISAYPTHQHREAVVGAMAVAAAAALAAAPERAARSRGALLDGVIALVPTQRRRRGTAPGPRHARLRRRGHRRGRAGLRAAYDGPRHRALRAVVGGARPGRLRSGVLDDRAGGRRRGHDLRHRRRHRRRGQAGEPRPPPGWTARNPFRPGRRCLASAASGNVSPVDGLAQALVGGVHGTVVRCQLTCRMRNLSELSTSNEGTSPCARRVAAARGRPPRRRWAGLGRGAVSGGPGR